MDLEATFGADKQDKIASNCEEDIFNPFEKSDEVNELMKTVNETQIDTAIHEQDHNYMDELLSYIGEGNNDGMDMTENRNGDESDELTKLLETQNSSDSALDRFMIRDIISPMSIDSGIGSDSGAMSLAKYSSHPGQNYNQRWNYLDRPHSTATTPSSSPVLRSSTPGFEPDNYGFEIENYSTSRSNTPTSDTSSAFNSKLVESSTTSDCFPISESIISCKSPDMMVGVNQGEGSDSCQDMVGVSQDEEDSDTSDEESEGEEKEEAEDSLETLRNNKSHKEEEQISPSNTQDGSNSNPTSSNSNPFIIISNPSSSISNPTTLSLPSTSSNSLPISSDSILSNVDPTSTMSNFPPVSSNSVVTSSCSIPNPSPPIYLETQNPVQTTSNFFETSSNVPISSSSSSVSWKVEIIDNSKRKTPSNPYKEREKAYWKKRKREDKNEPMKRKKVLWSFEEPVRSCKKECSSSHYSYEEDDDFDDLYMFSDMVGVNPGEDSKPSEDSEDSDTSDDESEEEEVETLINNKSSDTNRNSPIIPHEPTHLEDSNILHDNVDPPYLEDPSVLDPRINDDLEYLNTPNTSPSPLESSQCIGSNDSNLLCDPNNSSGIYPELPPSRPSTKRTSSASSELSSSRSSLKRKCPFPSDPSCSVIIPELKLHIEEDHEKSTETRSNFPRLRSLRPRSGAQIKKEEFKTPETPEYPRCLTKRSRNRDRKVKLYEKGKMANEQDEARRLRALQVKLNRDRIKFEGIRRDERLKELEKENEMLRKEAEERRVKECEGEKRKVDLEHALEESRRREEELLKLLEEAKKREEQLISQVRERQEKDEEEVEVAGGGIGKDVVNPQGLWTLAPPRSTVRLSHAFANKLNLFLIGFVLFWSLSRRYRKNR